MQPLFSQAGRLRLDQIVQPGMLCAFDFDGTLSPIVPQAEQAWLPPEIRQSLLRLTELAQVAVITGRALPDIRARLGFAPQFVLGNHGIEGLPDWERKARHYREITRRWRQQLQVALRAPPFDDPAISIEDKQYSLSVHYRHARDPAQAEKRLAALFGQVLEQVRVIPGKCVFNLLPEGAESKGSALEKLLRIAGTRHALYVGDDCTDEDVFALQCPGLLCVRIGHWSGSAAPFYLPDAHGMVPLLQILIQRLQSRPAAVADSRSAKGRAHGYT
jgi:trehalose 6-phosphate phosphatase